jgi:hypothetical protein
MSRMLYSSASALNPSKRLEIILNFSVVAIHASMLDQTLEDVARVPVRLVMLVVEDQAVVMVKEARSEVAIDWDFGRDELQDLMVG